MKAKSRNIKILIVIGAVIVFAIIGTIMTSDKQQPPSTTTANQNAAPAQATAPAPQPKTKMQTLKDLAGSEATFFIANSPELKEASNESEAPYKVVINSNNATDCSAAKTASYNTIKSIYTNNDVRDMVDQIVITYPGQLVTSLSGADGRSVNSWSGESNFYKLLFTNFEAKTRDPEGQKTWVVSIKGCK